MSVKDASAVLIQSYTTGTVPETIRKSVLELLEKDIPIFVLSQNRGNSGGLTEIKYDAGSEIYNAGALALEKVNTENVLEVFQTLQEAVKNKILGSALKNHMSDMYCYKKNEIVPIGEVDDEDSAGSIYNLLMNNLIFKSSHSFTEEDKTIIDKFKEQNSNEPIDRNTIRKFAEIESRERGSKNYIILDSVA